MTAPPRNAGIPCAKDSTLSFAWLGDETTLDPKRKEEQS